MQVNTFAHFPLNFISSVSASEIAGWLSFPDSRGVCSHCSRFWQHHWFLCASCTDPDRAHNLLRSSYHSCHHARREEKEGKARGVLRTTRGFFRHALLLEKKRANIQSELMTEEAANLCQFVHYLWQRWELITTYDSVSPCLGTTRCKIVATDKIRM